MEAPWRKVKGVVVRYGKLYYIKWVEKPMGSWGSLFLKKHSFCPKLRCRCFSLASTGRPETEETAKVVMASSKETFQILLNRTLTEAALRMGFKDESRNFRVKACRAV